MMRRAFVVVVALVLAVALQANTVAQSGPARVPVPDPGVLDASETRSVRCGEVTVEVRYYDFTPPDPRVWKSIGLALPRERNFAQGTKATPDAPIIWYIDSDRDGWAEATLSAEEFIERINGNACVAYLLYRDDSRRR